MANKAPPRHAFTDKIQEILRAKFGDASDDIFKSSELLGYLNHKTKSANSGSKSRGSFANHYALYVVIEDYIDKGYAPGSKLSGQYARYEGARFSDLFKRQRELPFGQKLQNHALNARLNDEFKKYFPTVEVEPIVRDVVRQRYWINEDLITVEVRGRDGLNKSYNLAEVIIEIVDAYVATKREAFEGFIEACRQIAVLPEDDVGSALKFVHEQLQPNVDARIFEIVSFAVLKSFYAEKTVFWGWAVDALNEEVLTLYKTGRTNANDGGIDFVMRPLGRFFQVTETLDVHKYFLDIDKIQKFPLTFVVKSMEDEKTIRQSIERKAMDKYKIEAIVKTYMNAVEEVINIPTILARLEVVELVGRVPQIMREIIAQSRVEFNYLGDDDPEDEDLLGPLLMVEED